MAAKTGSATSKRRLRAKVRRAVGSASKIRRRRASEWLRHWFFEKPELPALHLTWVFTAVLAAFAVQAFRDAKDASEKADQRLKLALNSQRAWIDVNPADKTPATLCAAADGSYYINYGVRVVNLGETPAIAVDDFISLNENGPTPCRQIDDFSDEPGKYTLGGRTVFPKRSSIISISVWLNVVGKAATMDPPFTILTDACISYGISGDRQTHHTSFDVTFDQPPGVNLSQPLNGACRSLSFKTITITKAD